MHARSMRPPAERRGAAQTVAPVYRGPQAVAHDTTSSLTHHAPNAALLIDFDNVTMGIQKDLHSELRNLLSSDIIRGKVAVQRAYADWRRYPGYIVPLTEASIDLIWAPAYGSAKKNATDIRLAVDAIELVFTRPEIGTFILLSGDSDFSSMVIKLKEYGKYVIGVGIRESSSDLLVQNCDEYYSYNALAGLVKTGEEELVKWDPWELVTESIGRMTKNGDVMRSDRLKQVMQEIDPSFDEKNAGFSKFSRFVQEASAKGLIKLVKLDNGQLEVAPVAERFPIPRTPTRGTAAVSEEREDAAGAGAAAGNGRRRRGRRGRGVREHEVEGTVESVHGASAPNASEPARKVPLSAIGRSGDRLTKQEAFDLVRRGLESLGNANGGVSARDLRRRAFELLGHDSESLSERMFVHILKDAHDAELIDLRRSGRDYEVESRQKVGDSVAPASVSDSLNRAAAATQHSGPAPSADTAPKTATPVPSAPSTGIGRMGRREVRGAGIRRGVPPADLLLVGVVDHVPTPVATATAQAGGGGGEALVVGSGAGEAVAARPVRAKRGRRVSAAAPKAKRPRRSAAKKETGPKPDAA